MEKSAVERVIENAKDISNKNREPLPSLSMLAKVVGFGFFGMMGSKATLTFKMVESKPSARMQEGLDELVKTGYLSRTGGTKRKPAVTYNALKPMQNVSKKDMREHGRFPTTEKI